jgi:tol-pal system protein YbgF
MRRIVVSKSLTPDPGIMKRALARLVCATLLALAGCETTPAEDPTQTRLDDLDTRVGRIDRIMANQSLVQLQQRVDSMQNELRALHGEIDELQNSNEALRKQQRDLYADLDKRLTGSAGTAAGPASGTTATSGGGGDEQGSYNRAFDLLKSADYPGAIAGFTRTAATFPDGALADNTQYWLGEAYYVTRDYDSAAAAFQRVLSKWPSSRKAPDALLKLGFTQIEQKRAGQARATLRQVVDRYPGTDAARLAADRLTKMPADAR